MRILRKVLKILAVVLTLLVVSCIVWWCWPSRTPKISSSTDSVAKIDYVEIGGLEQCVLVRSKNTDNPIMLFLHGGPGMSMMYLAHEFQRPLEENFTVVQWDRRAAGKTYSHNKSAAADMNVRQIIDDAYALIDTLQQRYNKRKLILVGHSFGTYLGSIMVNERPHLFEAYVSVGQVVDNEKELVLQEAFIRGQARKNNREDILSALDDSPKPDFETWLFEFGGELKASTSFFPLIWSGIQAPEFTLPEVLDVGNGSSFSSSNMHYNVLENSILKDVLEYQVPVYFVVGKSDYTTPHELITEYYKLIKAPKKEIIYFEHSAHFPFFEEPDKFCSEMRRLFKD